MEKSMEASQKLKMEPPYGLAIPLLNICPTKKKILIQKDISTSMFIAALFVVTKIWKPHKFSLIEIMYRQSTVLCGTGTVSSRGDAPLPGPEAAGLWRYPMTKVRKTPVIRWALK